MISSMLVILIWLVVVGLIFWVVWWGIGAMGIPEPFNKVLRVVVILIAAIMVIMLLLNFLPAFPGGHLNLG